MERTTSREITGEVLVLSHSVSPRLAYITDHLSTYYGLNFHLIYDEERYKSESCLCRINYSYHRIVPGEIFIHSHALLFESSIRPVKTDCFETRDFKAFFKTEGDTGFDLFAAIFFLLTRYEEYLPHKKDNYGRYAHEEALAFRENFLTVPLVDLWLDDFSKLLIEKNPAFPAPNRQFSFRPTYDIDMAWSFLHKGWKRNLGALALLFIKLKFGKAMQRIQVLKRKRKDPFDAYEWMDQLHAMYNLSPVYFFLFAKERSQSDRNIDIHNKAFHHVVKELAAKYETGIHPSWYSGDHSQMIAVEKKALEHVIGRIVESSRQHYIRFDLPSTYRLLIEAGIRHEYSMGYGSINGFRASVAHPFYWYDLKKEEKTSLVVHSFCFMDANAFYENEFTPEEAYEEMMRMYE
ncbi:MAG: DUF7033 domain-containing protein, partial [Flavisolibacter sp.]